MLTDHDVSSNTNDSKKRVCYKTEVLTANIGTQKTNNGDQLTCHLVVVKAADVLFRSGPIQIHRLWIRPDPRTQNPSWIDTNDSLSDLQPVSEPVQHSNSQSIFPAPEHTENNNCIKLIKDISHHIKSIRTDRHDDVRLVAVEAYQADIGVGQTKTIWTGWNAFITVP